MTSLALGLILAFVALQGVQAGERRNHLPLATKVNFKVQNPNSKGENAGLSRVSAAMFGGRSDLRPAVARLQSNAAGEFSFSPVSPLALKSAARSEAQFGNEAAAHKASVAAQAKEDGPTTDPAERKAVTFFRLNPKFGDVSVQPVVGGVNGAQLAVGF